MLNNKSAITEVYESAKAPYGAKFSHCVACHGPNILFWAKKSFSYTLSTRSYSYDIFRCAACGTGFLNPPPSEELLSRIYAFSGHSLSAPISLATVLESERSFPNSTVDASRMVGRGSILNQSGIKRALDVGAGYGFATREFKIAGFDTVSLNPGEFENDVFEEMNGYRPIPCMLNDYQTTDRFGIVLLSQVLEHIVQPDSAIKTASSLLAPGGVLVCAVPNFRSASVALLGTRDNSCLWVPEHVNYFTVDGLSRLVERHGLRVIEATQISRIRYNSLSRRLPNIPGKFFMDLLVRIGQMPITTVINFLGMGLYINLYAIKER